MSQRRRSLATRLGGIQGTHCVYVFIYVYMPACLLPVDSLHGTGMFGCAFECPFFRGGDGSSCLSNPVGTRETLADYLSLSLSLKQHPHPLSFFRP
jgi:hypothetical protein